MTEAGRPEGPSFVIRSTGAVLALLLASAAARAEDAQPSAPPAGGAPAASSGNVSASPRSGRSSIHGSVEIRASTGSAAADLFLGLLTFGIYASAAHEAASERHEMLDDWWSRMLERKREEGERSASDLAQRRYGYSTERRRDAREGFLFSFGVGGGALRYSDPTFARTGALNFGLRMGYGFSDRFQLFGDVSADAAFYSRSRELTNWLVSLRGQTVLVGDTLGNGLNLNLGFGIGGISIDYGGFAPDLRSAAAPAVVAGLSYDARVGRQFALSPELYFSWHKVPNGSDIAGQPLADDHLWATGLRLNFLWYSPVF